MAKANKQYYSLLVKYNNKWAIQFGSYDKQDCDDEREEYIHASCATKVIKTDDNQAAIDAKVNELNNKECSKAAKE